MFIISGDSLSYHDGMMFSTSDSDNDLDIRNCASENKGGWWFNSCYSSNLNGLYRIGNYTQAQDYDQHYEGSRSSQSSSVGASAGASSLNQKQQQQNKHKIADGIVWYALKGTKFYSLRAVEMKVKPLHA